VSANFSRRWTAAFHRSLARNGWKSSYEYVRGSGNGLIWISPSGKYLPYFMVEILFLQFLTRKATP